MPIGTVLGENSIEHNAKIVIILIEKITAHVLTVNVCMSTAHIYPRNTHCTKQDATKALKMQPLAP